MNNRRRLTLSSREYRHLRNSRQNNILKKDDDHQVEAAARCSVDAILDKSENNNDNNDVVEETMKHNDSDDEDDNNHKDANDGGINHIPMQSSVTTMPASQRPPQEHVRPKSYTVRTSAYVQHIAEVCHIINTDLRWRTLSPTSSPMPATSATSAAATKSGASLHEQRCSHCSTNKNARTTTLFSWEFGDDLSAVMAFASLYENTDDGHDTNTKNDKNDNTNDDDDEIEDTTFESAMHLYSRMYHRKGPWFDIVDIFDRYYYNKPPPPPLAAPPPPPLAAKFFVNKINEDEDDRLTMKKMKKEMSASTAIIKPIVDNVIEIIDSSGDDEKVATTNNDDSKNSKKRSTMKNFFTPRQQRMSLSKSSPSHDHHDCSRQVAEIENALHRLFVDVLRLSSMGFIRTFSTEYECGDVIGNTTRGGLLSIDERREILRQLGGGGRKSPSTTTTSKNSNNSSLSNSSSSNNSSSSSNNEILNQMLCQQSVLTSFSKMSSISSSQKMKNGKESRGSSRVMLPVIKHVNRLLRRKMAQKLASMMTIVANKTDTSKAEKIIHKVWSTAYTCHCKFYGGHDADGEGSNNKMKDTVFAFRLREAPLRALRRYMRLFLCAGGGPGAMRGDGTNGWISVLDKNDQLSSSTSSSESKWHNVVYPGLQSRFGLEYYEFRDSYYNNISVSTNSDTTQSSTNVKGPFTCYCEFQSWETGVEIRSFIDRANEIYEIERQIQRKRGRESRELLDDTSTRARIVNVEKNATVCLLGRDGYDLLTKEGREDIVTSIMLGTFTVDISVDFTVIYQIIENDILLLSNSTTGDDDDGYDDDFICDAERIIAVCAIICHRILQIRIKYPSAQVLSLIDRPWLRHLCLDATLAYVLWDCVPIFERRGHHLSAVSILQTLLFGQDGMTTNCLAGDVISNPNHLLCQETIKAKPYVECLLPRRNRGKAMERLFIDNTHAERRAKKQMAKEEAAKGNKKSRTGTEETDQSPPRLLCNFDLSNMESIPFCSVRNLARRSSMPLPQTNERRVLLIRPKCDDWSPITDVAVANAITSDSNRDVGTGKRCSFVGWEMHTLQDEQESHRSLNVEELAMEEYHFGRLPDVGEGDDIVKGNWVGWHDEGAHVRALFRILCLECLMKCCSDNELEDEHSTVRLTPYQRSPHDLHVGNFCTVSGSQGRGFYERRRNAIESYLTDLAQLDARNIGDKVYEAIKIRWDHHVDDRSRLKDTRLLKDVMELKTLSLIACAIGPVVLTRIFRTLCFDYRHWSGGLPDLLMVRGRYESPTGDNVAPSAVNLADWIGEGFSPGQIDVTNRQNRISMLTDRDDEFLGQPKNADGFASLNAARNKQGSTRCIDELPLLPEKLVLLHEGCQVTVECMFVEVKSANDRLSERQEDWLSILDPLARVCKFVNAKEKLNN